MRLRKKVALLAVSTVFALPAIGAHASLQLLGPQDFQGTGLGNVNTMLTMTSKGNATFESASVGLNSTGTQVIGGNALTGSSQTRVRSLNSLGIPNATDLRVVFNANEPNNAADKSIALENLVLNIYSPTGQVLFTSGAFTPQVFPDTFNGTGNSGFVFGLDSTQAKAAQEAAFKSGFGDNLVGLSAAAGAAAGGPETFFVAAAPVPEPSTYGMMLVGLGLGAFVVRRRTGR
jgi:hypothetical protein